jgi:hypothetical protein
MAALLPFLQKINRLIQFTRDSKLMKDSWHRRAASNRKMSPFPPQIPFEMLPDTQLIPHAHEGQAQLVASAAVASVASVPIISGVLDVRMGDAVSRTSTRTASPVLRRRLSKSGWARNSLELLKAPLIHNRVLDLSRQSLPCSGRPLKPVPNLPASLDGAAHPSFSHPPASAQIESLPHEECREISSLESSAEL